MIITLSAARGRPIFGYDFGFGSDYGEMNTFGGHLISAESYFRWTLLRMRPAGSRVWNRTLSRETTHLPLMFSRLFCETVKKRWLSSILLWRCCCHPDDEHFCPNRLRIYLPLKRCISCIKLEMVDSCDYDDDDDVQWFNALQLEGRPRGERSICVSGGAIICAAEPCFNFPPCYPVSEPERVKGDWYRKSSPNFALFAPPCKICGRWSGLGQFFVLHLTQPHYTFDGATIGPQWDWSPVASLGGGPPRVTPSRGDTRRKKNLWTNLQRIVEKRGRTGKKGVGWHPGGCDTRVKAIKSDSDSDSDEQKKVARFWEEETRDDTAELATKKRSPGFSRKK